MTENRKITINVEGYGQIKSKIPKKHIESSDAYVEGFANAVAETMTLVTKNEEKFHPAMGRML